MWLLSDLLKVVISRRALVDHAIDSDSELKITGSDISARDNVAHSIASVNILNTLERLKDMGLISDRELLRAVYRFAGEPADIEELLEGGSGVDTRQANDPIQPVSKDPINDETANPKKSVLP
jgi:hypothetical protein